MNFYDLIVSGNVECLQVFEGDFAPYSTEDIQEGLDLSGIKSPEFTLRYKKTAKIRDWASVIVPVLSKKFKLLIEEVSNGEAQFFPIIAEREDKMERYDLYVLNYLTRIDAIDLKKSETFGKKKDILYYITHPCLISSKLEGLDIFRLVGADSRIFVSEKLAKLIRANNITGVDLLPVKSIQ